MRQIKKKKPKIEEKKIWIPRHQFKKKKGGAIFKKSSERKAKEREKESQKVRKKERKKEMEGRKKKDKKAAAGEEEKWCRPVKTWAPTNNPLNYRFLFFDNGLPFFFPFFFGHAVLRSRSEFDWVWLGFIGFDWVLLGFP